MLNLKVCNSGICLKFVPWKIFMPYGLIVILRNIPNRSGGIPTQTGASLPYPSRYVQLTIVRCDSPGTPTIFALIRSLRTDIPITSDQTFTGSQWQNLTEEISKPPRKYAYISAINRTIAIVSRILMEDGLLFMKRSVVAESDQV
jgi:hypothetical protein